jgi:hypothetical protein
MRKCLTWSEPDDFNQQEAKFHAFTFIAWQNKEYGELRVIRRDNVGGLISPIQDFSLYAPDRKTAMKVAEKIARALKPVIEHNTLIPLY